MKEIDICLYFPRKEASIIQNVELLLYVVLKVAVILFFFFLGFINFIFIIIFSIFVLFFTLKYFIGFAINQN